MTKGSREINPFGLRMPPKLRKRVETIAAENGRSMNAEIIHVLEQHYAYIFIKKEYESKKYDLPTRDPIKMIKRRSDDIYRLVNEMLEKLEEEKRLSRYARDKLKEKANKTTPPPTDE